MRTALYTLVLLLAVLPATANVPGFGTYSYDEAGNITSVGADTYTYDTFGRLATATAGGHLQAFVYDRYGNIRVITTDGDTTHAIRPGVDITTNWANLTHDPASGTANNMITAHDDAGNVTSSPGAMFAYDALNVVTRSTVNGVDRLHIYSATDERLATITVAGGAPNTAWTIRDTGGRVLRRFSSNPSGNWHWAEDYVYAGAGQLLAAEVPSAEKVRHFHADHLGTPRLTTGNGGAEVARHTYYPFGKRLTIGTGEPLEFTGHERDADSLDYMHARYYEPFMGRFLSIDPGRDWNQRQPQSFNLFSYVKNNPVNANDPTGLWTVSIGISFGKSVIGWHVSTKYAIAVDDDGNIALARSRAAGGGAIATIRQGSIELAGEWSPGNDTVQDMNGTNLNIGGGGGFLGVGGLEMGFDRGPASLEISGGLGAGGEAHAVLEQTTVLGSFNVGDLPAMGRGAVTLLSRALHIAMESATTPPPPQARPKPEEEEVIVDPWAFHP